MRAQALGKHRAEDIGLLGVRQCTEDVHVVDVLLEQQLFVGGIADQDDRTIELLGYPAGASRFALDDLHLVGLLERERQANADVATARNDDTPHRVLELAHLAHEDADVFAVCNEEDLVTLLDDGLAIGEHGLALAVYRCDAAFGIRYVFLQCCDTLPDQQSVTIGDDSDEPDSAIGEIQHLRRAPDTGSTARCSCRRAARG